MKRTKRNTKPRAIHIAVVVSEKVHSNEVDFIASKREHGDWASFVGTDQDEVIRQAKLAMNEWQSSGPYLILVGTLTGEVRFPIDFMVVKL